MSRSKYLFIITGSISAYKTLDVISTLRKEGHEIKVVMTKAAQKFVTPLTFAAISNGEVYSDLFDAKDPMSHIDLARWADQIVVAPATANYINKITAGIADDLASNIYLAHDFTKPFIIYPAMNQTMLDHPQTQTSLSVLEMLGVTVKETGEGILACGEVGYGKLQTPEQILKDIKTINMTGTRILITSGGTKEPIDGVRHIGNMSSGSTGKILGQKLVDDGHAVTFLHAKDSKVPAGAKLKEFTSFNSLNELLKTELKDHYDYIIHLAAISDYSVDYLKGDNGERVNTDEKLSSDLNYSIHLKKNPKLIANLKDYSRNKKVKIIGFKLTDSKNEEKKQCAIAKVLANPGVQFVVHNDLSDITNDQHKFTIYSSKNKSVAIDSKDELASALSELIKDIPKIKEVTL